MLLLKLWHAFKNKAQSIIKTLKIQYNLFFMYLAIRKVANIIFRYNILNNFLNKNKINQRLLSHYL